MTSGSVPPGRMPGRGDRPAEVIAEAVLSVAGVAGLHGGTYGQVATYYPGKSVTGVRVRDGSTDVHVVAVWGVAVPEIADRIRARLQPLLADQVNITVEDVVDPDAAAGPDGAGRPLDRGVHG